MDIAAQIFLTHLIIFLCGMMLIGIAKEIKDEIDPIWWVASSAWVILIVLHFAGTCIHWLWS
jgi:hypothetical protein